MSESCDCEEFMLPEITEDNFGEIWSIVAGIEGRFPKLNLVLQFLRERSPNPEETAMIENLVKSLKKEFDQAMQEAREVILIAQRRKAALGYVGETALNDIRASLSRAVGILNSANREICNLLHIFDKWTQAKIEQAKYQRVVVR